MSEPVYEPVQLIVDNLVLQGLSADYLDTNAVSKAYVDGKVSTAVSNLINGADAALDTLKELGDALAASGGTLSTEILNKVADEKKERQAADTLLRTDLGTEWTNRLNADVALGNRIDDEETARISAVNAAKSEAKTYTDNVKIAVDASIDNEKKRAEDVESKLDGRVFSNEQNISTNAGYITSLQDDKMNKSGGNFSGDIKLVDSYLNFGDNWRVKASGDGSRIVFEFLKAGVWKPALPFICKV